MAAKCVMCDIDTLKYKCPKCFARYCSVACCKSHKAQCQETTAANVVPPPQRTPAIKETQVPNYPLWSAEVKKNVFPINDEDKDRVSTDKLELLRENDQIKSLLHNPHLRAICENLVNSENPSLDMAKVMQEPIFMELADKCLKVVDSDNPHLEPQSLCVPKSLVPVGMPRIASTSTSTGKQNSPLRDLPSPFRVTVGG